MKQSKKLNAGSLDSVVGLRSFSAVMDYAARSNWSEQLLMDVCKQKFGRVRHGVGVLRDQYRQILQAQSNDPSSPTAADGSGGAQPKESNAK